jgi:flagellar basal body-associated protein FliL
MNAKTIIIVIVVILAVAAAVYMGYKSFGPKKGSTETGPTTTQAKQDEKGTPASGASTQPGEGLPPPPGWTPPSSGK